MSKRGRGRREGKCERASVSREREREREREKTRKTEKAEWGDAEREERDRGVGGEDERGIRRSSYGDLVNGRRSTNRSSSKAWRVGYFEDNSQGCVGHPELAAEIRFLLKHFPDCTKINTTYTPHAEGIHFHDPNKHSYEQCAWGGDCTELDQSDGGGKCQLTGRDQRRVTLLT
ncbi:hypothetical protein ILYODFUR_004279 [Ilyodon furcidens]|uniref:Uncharacterized protein n=1 Tax=Ilyodon furcidens TaxID=33524 RepID=A0ABV0UQT9_9TELE